jgi:hypothetical protein
MQVNIVAWVVVLVEIGLEGNNTLVVLITYAVLRLDILWRWRWYAVARSATRSIAAITRSLPTIE